MHLQPPTCLEDTIPYVNEFKNHQFYKDVIYFISIENPELVELNITSNNPMPYI